MAARMIAIDPIVNTSCVCLDSSMIGRTVTEGSGADRPPAGSLAGWPSLIEALDWNGLAREHVR
jgi:hypothetical protein